MREIDYLPNWELRIKFQRKIRIATKFKGPGEGQQRKQCWRIYENVVSKPRVSTLFMS